VKGTVRRVLTRDIMANASECSRYHSTASRSSALACGRQQVPAGSISSEDFLPNL
jgi:hypothetical protein